MSTKVEKSSGFNGNLKKGNFKLNDEVRKKAPFRVTGREQKWNIKSSDFAMKTHNPIRAIVDGLKIEPNKDKKMIALSIGECL
jgi:tyrosine aminotransferase